MMLDKLFYDKRIERVYSCKVTALSLTKSQGLANYFLFFIQSRSPLRSFMENKKNNGTIAANPSQTNIESTYNYFLRLLFVSSTNERFIDAKKCNYTPFLDAKKIDFTPFLDAKNIRISLIYGVKKK